MSHLSYGTAERDQWRGARETAMRERVRAERREAQRVAGVAAYKRVPLLRKRNDLMIPEGLPDCDLARRYPVWFACWRSQCRLAYRRAA